MGNFTTSLVLAIQTPFYQVLQPGELVTLVPTNQNTKDPYAVEVYYESVLVGFVASSKETVISGTKDAACVHRLASSKKVSKTTAILGEEREFENVAGKKQRRFVAEMFFVPARANEPGESQSRQYNVGGVSPQNPKKATILAALIKATEKGEIPNIPVTLSRIKLGTIDNVTVYLPDCADAGAAGGIVTNVDSVLNELLENFSTLPAKAVSVGLRSTYVIEVQLPKDGISEFHGVIDEAVGRGVDQAPAIEEKVQFMKASRFSPEIIEAVVSQMGAIGGRKVQVPRPKTLYCQKTGENLMDTIAYFLMSKTLRLVGEKSAGKNTLAETACWLLNRPMCRVQGSSELDKLDLLGSKALKDSNTSFELSNMLETLRNGGVVVLDEVNTVRPEVLTIMHSLTDGARSIDVPGYGLVTMAPSACIVYTMNEGYVGTGDMNQATIDRGPTLIVKAEDDLGVVLKRAVPTASQANIDVCVGISRGIKKAILESGQLSPESDSIRGYIDALETLPIIPLRRGLIQNVANKAQSEAERGAITTIITSMTE